MRLMRLALLTLGFFSVASGSKVTSIDSLLRSPCDVLMSRCRLARLERRRPNCVDVNDAGRSPRNGSCGRCCGVCAGLMLSRVMVELLLVSDGMSLELRTSGPGSPMRRDWKWSSVTDEGAVEMRLASNDIGVRGEGKADDCVEYGLMGANEAVVGSWSGLISAEFGSLHLGLNRGDGVVDEDESWSDRAPIIIGKAKPLSCSSMMTSSCKELAE